MKILILGGAGFCGWPTVLHLSALGHDVAIVYILSRRRPDISLDSKRSADNRKKTRNFGCE